MAFQFSLGGKTRVCQEIYSQYSRLEFTRHEDRPIGIAGLEKRLIHSFNVRGGGFGVLDNTEPGLLRRSLLWHRPLGDVPLEAINFRGLPGPTAAATNFSPPPSWSWMAYKGAIEYLFVPFNQVEWEDQDVRSPWLRSPSGTWSYSGDRSNVALELTVVARVFEPQAADEAAGIILDTPPMTSEQGRDLMCVVLGRMKSDNQSRESRIHFVLLVTAEDSGSPVTACNAGIFRRRGVGRLPGKCIRWDEPVKPGQVR